MAKFFLDKWDIILISLFIFSLILTYLRFMPDATPFQQTVGFIAGSISTGLILAIVTKLILSKALK